MIANDESCGCGEGVVLPRDQWLHTWTGSIDFAHSAEILVLTKHHKRLGTKQPGSQIPTLVPGKAGLLLRVAVLPAERLSIPGLQLYVC